MICFWSQESWHRVSSLPGKYLSSPTTQSPVYFVKSHLKYLSPPTPSFLCLEHLLFVFSVLTTILNNHYVLVFLCKLQYGRGVSVCHCSICSTGHGAWHMEWMNGWMDACFQVIFAKREEKSEISPAKDYERISRNNQRCQRSAW